MCTKQMMWKDHVTTWSLDLTGQFQNRPKLYKPNTDTEHHLPLDALSKQCDSFTRRVTVWGLMQCFVDVQCMWKVTSLKVLHIEKKTPFLLNNNKTAMVLRNKERVANLARTKCALSYSTFLLVLPSVLIVFVDLYHVCHC